MVKSLAFETNGAFRLSLSTGKGKNIQVYHQEWPANWKILAGNWGTSHNTQVYSTTVTFHFTHEGQLANITSIFCNTQ